LHEWAQVLLTPGIVNDQQNSPFTERLTQFCRSSIDGGEAGAGAGENLDDVGDDQEQLLWFFTELDPKNWRFARGAGCKRRADGQPPLVGVLGARFSGDDLVAPMVHLADAFIADKKVIVRSWVREHSLHLVASLEADRTAAGEVWSNWFQLDSSPGKFKFLQGTVPLARDLRESLDQLLVLLRRCRPLIIR
jgi:hypothetical protein